MLCFEWTQLIIGIPRCGWTNIPQCVHPHLTRLNTYNRQISLYVDSDASSVYPFPRIGGFPQRTYGNQHKFLVCSKIVSLCKRVRHLPKLTDPTYNTMWISTFHKSNLWIHKHHNVDIHIPQIKFVDPQTPQCGHPHSTNQICGSTHTIMWTSTFHKYKLWTYIFHKSKTREFSFSVSTYIQLSTCSHMRRKHISTNTLVDQNN